MRIDTAIQAASSIEAGGARDTTIPSHTMRLAQLQRPLQAAAIARTCRPTLSAFTLPIRPSIPAPSQTTAAGSVAVEGRRFASVKSQGAYRIPNKKTIAKKLGAKKSGGMFLSTGCWVTRVEPLHEVPHPRIANTPPPRGGEMTMASELTVPLLIL